MSDRSPIFRRRAFMGGALAAAAGVAGDAVLRSTSKGPTPVITGGLAEVVAGSAVGLTVRAGGGELITVAIQDFPDDWSFTPGDLVMLLPADSHTLVAVPYLLVEGTKPNRQVYAFNSRHESRMITTVDEG